MSNNKFRVSGWMIQLGLGILLLLISFYFLLSNQIHTGLIFLGIGLIPIALIFANPFHAIRAMRQAPKDQEIEKIDLEFDM